MHESLKLSEHSQEKKLSTGVHENKKRIVGNRPVLGRSVGRVQGGRAEANSSLGTIIVYRPWSLIGSPMTNWEFNPNHGPDLKVRNGTYYRLTARTVSRPTPLN
jgi:hypothetical protein